MDYLGVHRQLTRKGQKRRKEQKYNTTAHLHLAYRSLLALNGGQTLFRKPIGTFYRSQDL